MHAARAAASRHAALSVACKRLHLTIKGRARFLSTDHRTGPGMA
jgi:hypothetical protein